MVDRYTQLATVLMDLEAELRASGLWQRSPPSPEALASTQPFAIDTLNFPQWVQFVFIPRLYERIEVRAPLPDQCNVAPMAEEYFRASFAGGERLIGHLHAVDRLLSQ